MGSTASMTIITDPAMDPSFSPPISASIAPLCVRSPSMSLQVSGTTLTVKKYLTWSQFMLVMLKASHALMFINSTTFLLVLPTLLIVT
ncbi:hypothetical protein Lal_00018750 [Lupinus albus]|nr:hypothetical protein Lal_00018750 [Lupinus albus]